MIDLLRLNPFRYALLLVATALLCGCVEVEFSPDGRRLALGGYMVGQGNGLCIVDRDGRNFRRLPGGEDGFAPKWSPDGRYLLYTASNTDDVHLFSASQGKITWDLRYYDLRTLRSGLIFRNVSEEYGWSSDGRTIAAVDDHETLRLISFPDRQNRVKVSLPGLSASALAFVPRSEMVVLLLASDQKFGGDAWSNADAYLYSHGSLVQLTHSKRVVGISPVGSFVLIASQSPGGGVDVDRYDLKNWRLGTDIRRIPEWPAGMRHNGWRSIVGPAVFSPAGTYLAFVAWRTRNIHPGPTEPGEYEDALVARTDGADVHLVHREYVPAADRKPTGYLFPPGPVLYPSWSPDSASLALMVQQALPPKGRHVIGTEKS